MPQIFSERSSPGPMAVDHVDDTHNAHHSRQVDILRYSGDGISVPYKLVHRLSREGAVRTDGVAMTDQYGLAVRGDQVRAGGELAPATHLHGVAVHHDEHLRSVRLARVAFVPWSLGWGPGLPSHTT